MELRDLIVTPIVLIVVYATAYFIRPFVTDEINRRYFLPALSVRIFGALAVGFIYQFYYDGGDTYNYHTHGSRHVWEAFMDSPAKGIKLLLTDGEDLINIYKYASGIPFLRDPTSYAIIRIAAVLDLITFSSYSATAVLFAVLSFIGMWMFFLTFYKQYPHLHRRLAIASFFIPSVVFWGSGLLKDTVTLACLGVVTYQVYIIFILKRIGISNVLLLLVCLYAIYVIKIYILLAFLPIAIIWVFIFNFNMIRPFLLRVMVSPLVMAAAVGLSYFSVLKAGEDNQKYSLNNVAETAKVTAYDIRYWTGRHAGSGYSLGELDGSFNSMLRLAPQAINVSLFRPYIWEVKNPLMLLSALEALILLGIVIYLVVSRNVLVFKTLTKPNIIYCLLFSIIFAFAVGVSTFNFGTLVRYKIPLLPFFVVSLTLIDYYSKRDKNVEVLEITE